MANSKKKSKKSGSEGEIIVTPEVDPILSQFDKLKLGMETDRHKNINDLFDKAADVISEYLKDPMVDSSAKMFPANLAANLFIAKEKFRREDAKILLEAKRLDLEEIKIKQSLGIPRSQTFNQQNNFNISSPTDLASLKKKQEEILSSYLPPDPKNPN